MKIKNKKTFKLIITILITILSCNFVISVKASDTAIIPNEKINIVENDNIKNLEELYGDSINVDYKLIADFGIISNLSDIELKDLSLIDIAELSNPIPLYDSNDKVIYYGFNFNIKSTNQIGYIIIAAHSKTSLIKEVVFDQILPTMYSKIYYLSEGEFYYSIDDGYLEKDLITYIDKETFNNLLNTKKEELYNITYKTLDDIETETKIQLNNIQYINNIENMPSIIINRII